jgi:hypothetical protein
MKRSTTNMTLLRLQSGLKDNSRSRVGGLGGYHKGKVDAKRVEPRSRGNLATDVCVHHARAHAVHDDEGAVKKNRHISQSDQEGVCRAYG